MLDEPRIVHTDASRTAVIRLTVPRDQIQVVMGPAIAEVLEAVRQSGMAPAGPVFSHHFRMDPAVFDFEVGVPVARDIVEIGRVRPSLLPAVKAARTVYRGPYEGLGPAWAEFDAWIDSQRFTPAPNLWEYYATGPESDPDPATWRTELNRPLIG